MTDKELKWHRFYLKLAKMYSEFSKDPRTKVGTVLVSSDLKKILSVGYNGWARGEPDIPDSLEIGGHGTVHAECNCLIMCDNKNQYPNSILFCTINPCRICSRMIVNFGTIGTVVYEEEYRDISGLQILRNAGISVMHISKE